MDNDGQITFNSSDIKKTKAGDRPNYFVNVRRGSAIDKISKKIDQKKFYEEVEARKRAEAEALRKEKAKEAAALSENRFTKKDVTAKLPDFSKIQGSSFPVRPAARKVVVSQSEPHKTLNTTTRRVIYITCAVTTFVLSAAFVVWSLIPKENVITKQASVAKPLAERTVLDDITDKRVEIINIFESDGKEAGLKAYSEYLSTLNDPKTLALARSWRALDLYNLYHDEYKDIIIQDAYAAEELDPTDRTATLIYSFEREFGSVEKSKTYFDLIPSRKPTTKSQ